MPVKFRPNPNEIAYVGVLSFGLSSTLTLAYTVNQREPTNYFDRQIDHLQTAIKVLEDQREYPQSISISEEQVVTNYLSRAIDSKHENLASYQQQRPDNLTLPEHLFVSGGAASIFTTLAVGLTLAARGCQYARQRRRARHKAAEKARYEENEWGSHIDNQNLDPIDEALVGSLRLEINKWNSASETKRG